MNWACGAALLATLTLLNPTSADARTVRSAAVTLEFKRHNPCPSTGLRRGACPGWEIDHVVALCANGADHVDNLQWLTREQHLLKTRADMRVCRALRREAVRQTPYMQ